MLATEWACNIANAAVAMQLAESAITKNIVGALFFINLDAVIVKDRAGMSMDILATCHA
jgi:hypothetical protein